MLHPDINNKTGSNKVWTEVSEAKYGFIVPGTSTYAIFGINGGIDSGIGYKATRTDGSVCPGPCAFDPSDNYNFFWFYDVFDFLAVRRGDMQPYEVKPYLYGKLDVPFQYNHFHKKRTFMPINGAAYNKKENRVYLSISGAGQQSRFSSTPVMVGYDISF